MIKKRFAEDVKNEVLEHLIQASVGEALREKNLVPLGQPKIGDLKFAFEEPLSFRVELEVRPAVEPKDYRGLKVPAGNAVPTAEDIDGLIGRIREGHSTYEPIEGRAAKDGDFALVDIKGSFPKGDGKDFAADKTLVEIGGAHTMPELSAHLRNAEPGVTVTFQKDWAADVPDKDFAGKTVLYTVHLAALKSRVLPALDDEFARLALTPREGEAPEGANLAMLNEKVADSLRREKEQAVKETRRRAVLDGLLALHDVPAPETMVESEIDSALKDYARHLSREGVDLKEAQVDWNELRKEARAGGGAPREGVPAPRRDRRQGERDGHGHRARRRAEAPRAGDGHHVRRPEGRDREGGAARRSARGAADRPRPRVPPRRSRRRGLRLD